SRRVRTETPETLTSLLANTDALHAYSTLRGYTSRTPSGLEVVATLDDPYVQTLDDRDYVTLTGTLRRHYQITLLDPAATGVARALPVVDGLVLVAPASADAARSVALTFEWLDGHGYADLRSRAIVVINGVSRRSLADVDAAEQVARGNCRAIVRVPWDDHIAAARSVIDVKALRQTTRRAHAALAAVVAAHLAARTTEPERRPPRRATAPHPRRRRADERQQARQQAGGPLFRRSRAAQRHRSLGLLPPAHDLLRVLHPGGTGGPGHQHHDRAGRDPDERRRGAPAHRPPHLPGRGVGDPARRHLRLRPRLVRLPRRDVPARVGQGLLDQGGLPGGAPGAARSARPALPGRVRAAVRRLPAHRTGPRPGGRRRRRPGDRPLDRPGRTPRPGAGRQLPARPPRPRRRTGLAAAARRHRHHRGAPRVGRGPPPLGPRRDRGARRRRDPQRTLPPAPGTGRWRSVRVVP